MKTIKLPDHLQKELESKHAHLLASTREQMRKEIDAYYREWPESELTDSLKKRDLEYIEQWKPMKIPPF